MNNRRPKTATWHLIERTCRTISGPGWRRTAARLLGVEIVGIRDRFDRDDLAGDVLDDVHCALHRAVTRHHEAAKLGMLRITAAASAVHAAREARLDQQRRVAEAVEEADRATLHAARCAFDMALVADLLEA